MKYVSLDQATPHSNSNTCKVLEYGDNGANDIAVIEINGRYPEKDAARNKSVGAAMYIINGEGIVTVEGAVQPIHTGDVMFVKSGEKYFFEGQFTMLMSCTPAWSPGQYEEVK